MPKILPIRDLKNTTKISALCHQTNEPIFITKDGYGDMVIMSMETYEEAKYLKEVIGKIEEGEKDIQEGKVTDAKKICFGPDEARMFEENHQPLH